MNPSESIQILNMYFEEWKYRHENFWKRLTQFTAVIFFTNTLPITFRIFENLTLPNMPMLFFPICGAVLSVLCLLFCWSENSRLVAVDKTIKRILGDGFGEKYLKDDPALFNNDARNQRLKKLSFFKWRIGTWVPLVMTILQLALSGLVIYLIAAQKI